GDDAVGRRLLVLQTADRVVDAAVDAELGERTLVDQQVDALTGRELVLGVLARNALLAAAELGGLAARLKVFDQRTQNRWGDLVGGPASGDHLVAFGTP